MPKMLTTITITDEPLDHLFDDDITDRLLDLNMRVWDRVISYASENEGITQLTITAITYDAYKEEFGIINATLIDLINVCIQQVVKGLTSYEEENEEESEENRIEVAKSEGEQENV